MADRGEEITRTKDGRAWRVGLDAEIAWISESTHPGLAITSAIPASFAAYATVELPGTGEHDAASWLEDPDRHTAGMLAVLGEHTAAQPWWLGYLESGVGAETIFYDVPKVRLYSRWPYVLIEAGPEQARSWRKPDPHWNRGVPLPDLMFPADRSWLVSTLWDDDWTCVGGSPELIESLRGHPDLRHRVRLVDPYEESAIPPGHTPF